MASECALKGEIPPEEVTAAQELLTEEDQQQQDENANQAESQRETGRGRGRSPSRRGRGGMTAARSSSSSRGGSGRGRGGSSRRGGTGSSNAAATARQQTKRDDATTGWTTESIHDWELVDEDAFLCEAVTGRFLQHTRTIMAKLDSKIERRFNGEQPRRADFVLLLLEPALDKLVRLTNEALPGNAVRTNQVEFMRFLGTLVGLSTMVCSPSKAYEFLTALKWSVLAEQRYKEILRSLRAYPCRNREGHWDRGWVAQGDLTPNLASLEDCILEESRRLLLCIQNSCLVLDDELISSRSQNVQVKSLNQRKAGKEGHAMDVIADGFTRVVLAIRLKRRGDDQDHSVQKLLESLKEEYPESWRGGIVTMDRGYCKPKLVETVLGMGLGCAFIVPDHLVNHHPFCSARHFTPAFEYLSDEDDSTAERSVPGTRPSNKWIIPNAPLLGPAVYSASKTISVLNEPRATAQKVHAVAVRERGDKRATKVLRFYMAWPTIQPFIHKWTAVYIKGTQNRAKDWLFYPSDDGKSEARVRIETMLQDKVKPLTVGQRCADWFIARAHRCTGTMAKFISRYDPDARILLYHHQSEVIEEMPTNRELSFKFRESWYSNSTSTDEMKQGTKNEDKIIEALRGRSDIVVAICDVGLLQHREKPWLAVSPDAIALVRLPGSDDDAVVLATVELKTAVASSNVESLGRTSSSFGKVLVAEVGDEVWWSAVPVDHRAQVLHHMLVCNLNHALYVKATTTFIGYVVIVHASDEQLSTFGASLSCLEDLLGWAHESTLRVPDFIDQGTRDIITSHLRFWKMVDSYIKTNGPSKPVLLYRHAVQTLYSKIKGGLDGSSEYHDGFKPNVGAVDFERKFVLHSIFTVFFNAGIMWRMWQRREALIALQPGPSTIRKLRDGFNQVESINDFMTAVAPLISVISVLRLHTPGHTMQRPQKVNGQPMTRPKRCGLCIRETVYYCPVCQIFLCVTIAPGARASCFDTFHRRKKLPSEKINRNKRQYKKRKRDDDDGDVSYHSASGEEEKEDSVSSGKSV